MTKPLSERFAPYPNPETGPEVNAENLYRHMLAAAQIRFLSKERACDRYFADRQNADRREVYLSETNAMIAEWTSLQLLRVAMGKDPHLADPDALAEALWTAYDSGDYFGELLWTWVKEAGLDPDAIAVAYDEAVAEATS